METDLFTSTFSDVTVVRETPEEYTVEHGLGEMFLVSFLQTKGHRV